MSIWDVFGSIGNALDSGLRTVLSAGDTVVEYVGDAAQAVEDKVKENSVTPAVIAAAATG